MCGLDTLETSRFHTLFTHETQVASLQVIYLQKVTTGRASDAERPSWVSAVVSESASH